MGGKGAEIEEGNGNRNGKGMTGKVANTEIGTSEIDATVEAESVTVEETVITDMTETETGTGIETGITGETGIVTGTGAGIVTEAARGSCLSIHSPAVSSDLNILA
ncbi:hypothetical protein CRG98_024736 [Punica granatum]|uniref:Uncharacterized protein n=1 Tax=Punica granatum TaxID=22663 RepID=A0A2I0JFW4_PUNGR|nr:hypothetical protein CRG98_024736 [Punica granatum]